MTLPAKAWPVQNLVEAPLRFRIKGDRKPVSYASAPGTDTLEIVEGFEWQTVSIADGRPVIDRLSLDGAGFELRPHDTAVSDFYDDDEVRAVYYPEVEHLVKAATGASRVVIFDHTVRIDDAVQRNKRAARGPARVVHNDYTERSGPQRVHDLLDTADAEIFLQHRFAVVNVWRAIGAPIETAPLAIADAQSMAAEDLIATDLVLPDRTGEIYQVAFNPDHNWFYFPKIQYLV